MTNSVDQKRKIEIEDHVRLKNEHWHQRCIWGVHWRGKELLRRGLNRRKRRSTYGNIIKCSTVQLSTPKWHNWIHCTHPRLAPGGELANTTKNTTRTYVYNKNNETSWKRISIKEKTVIKVKTTRNAGHTPIFVGPYYNALRKISMSKLHPAPENKNGPQKFYTMATWSALNINSDNPNIDSLVQTPVSSSTETHLCKISLNKTRPISASIFYIDRTDQARSSGLQRQPQPSSTRRTLDRHSPAHCSTYTALRRKPHKVVKKRQKRGRIY